MIISISSDIDIKYLHTHLCLTLRNLKYIFELFFFVKADVNFVSMSNFRNLSIYTYIII